MGCAVHNSAKTTFGVKDGCRQHGEKIRFTFSAVKNDGIPATRADWRGSLVQTLIKHDLIDEFWLMIFPITLGNGKRLFAGGTMPMAFKATEIHTTPNGVIVANYARAGEVATARAGTNRKG